VVVVDTGMVVDVVACVVVVTFCPGVVLVNVDNNVGRALDVLINIVVVNCVVPVVWDVLVIAGDIVVDFCDDIIEFAVRVVDGSSVWEVGVAVVFRVVKGTAEVVTESVTEDVGLVVQFKLTALLLASSSSLLLESSPENHKHMFQLLTEDTL